MDFFNENAEYVVNNYTGNLAHNGADINQVVGFFNRGLEDGDSIISNPSIEYSASEISLNTDDDNYSIDSDVTIIEPYNNLIEGTNQVQQYTNLTNVPQIPYHNRPNIFNNSNALNGISANAVNTTYLNTNTTRGDTNTTRGNTNTTRSNTNTTQGNTNTTRTPISIQRNRNNSSGRNGGGRCIIT